MSNTGNTPHMKKHAIPVVMVTGGSQGLGYELALVLLQKGFAVSFCARTANDVERAAQRLEHLATEALLPVVGDITDSDFLDSWQNETVRQFGRIDAVVNNASTLGTVPLPNVLDSTEHNATRIFAVNFHAPFQLLKRTLPYLQARPRALVLGISSDAAVQGYAGWGIYGASKAAFDLAHKSLSKELSETTIQVHAVDPSDMDTAMHHAAEPDATGLNEPAFVAQALLPLFHPLLDTSAAWSYQSGVRLQVQAGGMRRWQA